MTTESKTSAAQTSAAQCPYTGSKLNTAGTYNSDWWPDRLDLSILRQHSPVSDPMGEDFDYAKEFSKLNIKAVKKDIEAMMTTSQEWWPADYGHYGPFFIRLAWHSAGTYRTHDGRGGAGAGMQRFAPINSWPDNGNLDKARRLLWPIKQKYGKSLSWADLMILVGNCAIESMGLKTFGFGGGRADVWEPDETYWGKEKVWLTNERYTGDRVLEKPLAAVQMGLIYVNPQGPDGNPDPLASARDIRETFARMAMNDEETVALVAGGHTFGKAHGAADPDKYVGPSPEGAPLDEMGLGWKNSFGTGKGADTITSGLEGAWTSTPTKWDNNYFKTLFKYEWQLTKSPGGAVQWIPTDESAAKAVPDAHISGKTHAPVMQTTDLALRMDPAYEKISRHFAQDLDALADAFTRAWFKLTHRDMGPVVRYLGPLVPKEVLIWQDPLPARPKKVIGKAEIELLKKRIRKSDLTIAQMVTTAWASASTFRSSDKRGGANGARIRLEPQRNWVANNPKELKKVLAVLEGIQVAFNKKSEKKVSLADLIVLAGTVAIEDAAANAGIKTKVAFTPGRTDATQDQTDVASFAYLEPTADGFRNYKSQSDLRPAEVPLVDKASLLSLTAPEMTVLVGGMRVLGANFDSSKTGVLTHKKEVLSTDFFINILDTKYEWAPKSGDSNLFEAHDRKSGKVKWSATRADLVFGSNSELRAVAEVYASSDAEKKFVQDFVAAWSKVMELDRFDLKK
jgi:catalase-peroxidase